MGSEGQRVTYDDSGGTCLKRKPPNSSKYSSILMGGGGLHKDLGRVCPGLGWVSGRKGWLLMFSVVRATHPRPFYQQPEATFIRHTARGVSQARSTCTCSLHGWLVGWLVGAANFRRGACFPRSLP